tara:strand:+ start:354 stop:791 length:438 start_codon:yes stop_codon:yes gene_type:complete
MPVKNKITLIITDKINISVGKGIAPSKMDRKPSITPTIGFNPYQVRKCSGIIEDGYTTGEANSQNWIIKGIVYLISLYFAFRAANSIPMPAEDKIIRRTKTGKRNIIFVGTIPNQNIIPTKTTKAMAKSKRPASTGVIGIISLGK